MTTLAGFLAGIPPIIIASGYVLTPKQTQILSMVSGFGVLIMGLAAKDSHTQPTMAEVQKSTLKAEASKN